MKTKSSATRPGFIPISASVLGFLCWASAPLAAQTPVDTYVNYGSVTVAPQIDAVNFINYGSFGISTAIPFETSDTLNYTNYGSLVGGVGWRFDYAPANAGVRQMAANFVNSNIGLVEADDLPGFLIQGFPNLASVTPSYLWVNATNIINQGTLSVGGNGWMLLVGTNVTLARSGVEVQEITAAGSFNGVFTNFFIPDTGIYDLWWGQTNLVFDTAAIWNGQTASAPPHPVQAVNGGGRVSFSIPNPIIDSFSNSFGIMIQVTNVVGITNPGPVIPILNQTNIVIQTIYVPTNIYKQAVFVGVSDPTTLSVGVSYYPSSTFTNPFKTVSVEISFLSTNVVTTLPEALSLFFYDTLASETNRGYYTNFSVGLTARPENYLLSRIDDGRFRAGVPGNGLPDPGFLYDPTTFSNRVVVGEYAGYGAMVDDLISEPPAVVGGTVTNFPGRVQIYAQHLDMSSARIRGAGEVIVNTEHLVSSSNAVVDCQNLSYNLASTNGHLNVLNLTKETVARLKGDLYAWSGLWSNTMTMVYSNNYSISNIVDTNGMTIGLSATQVPLTNSASVNLHTLLLDGDALQTQLPVTTWDMVTRSTNVVISDNMTVVEGFLVDGQSFTLNGNITFSQATIDTSIGTVFSSSISDWIYTNAPNLLYFTNNGTLTLPENGHFGDDGPLPYSAFVNTGTINAASISFNSAYFQDSGTLSSAGPLNMSGGIGKLENGHSSAGGNVQFSCNSLKLNNYQFTAAGQATFSIPGSFLDAGGNSGSQLTLQAGLTMLTKPASGDLLGTTFQLQLANFVVADHIWPGADRGATAAGYTNNLAIGKLVLAAQSTDPRRAPQFVFSGAGGQNGLYVDLLDLSNLGTNWNQVIGIDPSIQIYYAAAKLGFTPPANADGIPVEPEEYLDGQVGGHLHWVSGFAGPNSSVDVISNGITIAVNKALRFSKIIDSNGNGIPNYYDPNPFTIQPPVLSAAVASIAQPAGRSIAVSWNALANTLYQVEFCTDLQKANWQPLTDYTSGSVSGQRVTILDTNAPVNIQRFYRVRYTQ